MLYSDELNLYSENSSTVRQESSSDEEETIADTANDSMDIDNLDRKSPSYLYANVFIF